MHSLGIDVGTTSCKLCVLSTTENNRLVFSEQLTHHAHIHQDGFPQFDEQDASKILQTIDTLLAQSGVLDDIQSLKSVQICGQMHGLILWSAKSPRSVVSPLITWQDQRCSNDFLVGLGPSLNHLKTGFGLATLLWFMEEEKSKGDQLEKYDRAGTIADYLVTILCDDATVESTISTQMATSWGAVNKAWPVDHRLLPKIVEPGTTIGYWQKTVPVYVGLGDLQCSVFSCQPGEHQGIVNISTSAQLAMAIHRDQVSMPSSSLLFDRPSGSDVLDFLRSSSAFVDVCSIFLFARFARCCFVEWWECSVGIRPSDPVVAECIGGRISSTFDRSSLVSSHRLSSSIPSDEYEPFLCGVVRRTARSIDVSLRDKYSID